MSIVTGFILAPAAHDISHIPSQQQIASISRLFRRITSTDGRCISLIVPAEALTISTKENASSFNYVLPNLRIVANTPATVPQTRPAAE